MNILATTECRIISESEKFKRFKSLDCIWTANDNWQVFFKNVKKKVIFLKIMI